MSVMDLMRAETEMAQQRMDLLMKAAGTGVITPVQAPTETENIHKQKPGGKGNGKDKGGNGKGKGRKGKDKGIKGKDKAYKGKSPSMQVTKVACKFFLKNKCARGNDCMFRPPPLHADYLI